LCGELKRSGCKVGIEHFGRQFSQVGQLHGLGLDYIKVDAELRPRAGRQPRQSGFPEGAVRDRPRHRHPGLIAEGVVSEAEMRALAEVGFDGATGPAVREPAA
jgi:EAL domain-containing protein (putative c-di-GMP-specific phosphodiesterase class I)